MFSNNIRAIVINLERDMENRIGMIQELDSLKIIEYEILKAFAEQEVKFNSNCTGVLYENKVYDYGLYTGDFPFRRVYMAKNSIACSISNHIARNNQKKGYYTIVFEDDARFIGNRDTFKSYIDHLPAENDYDIIFLSDCTWSSTHYPKAKVYNDYYYYLPYPYFDISGTHVYIINLRILPLLNVNLTFNLAADDYLNYCINKFQLRVLIANEVLFTQRPENYARLKC